MSHAAQVRQLGFRKLSKAQKATWQLARVAPKAAGPGREQCCRVRSDRNEKCCIVENHAVQDTGSLLKA